MPNVRSTRYAPRSASCRAVGTVSDRSTASTAFAAPVPRTAGSATTRYRSPGYAVLRIRSATLRSSLRSRYASGSLRGRRASHRECSCSHPAALCSRVSGRRPAYSVSLARYPRGLHKCACAHGYRTSGRKTSWPRPATAAQVACGLSARVRLRRSPTASGLRPADLTVCYARSPELASSLCSREAFCFPADADRQAAGRGGADPARSPSAVHSIDVERPRERSVARAAA